MAAAGLIEELRSLAAEWEQESKDATKRADEMPRTDENVRAHTAERRQARVAMHHAAALVGVIERHGVKQHGTVDQLVQAALDDADYADAHHPGREDD